MTGFAELQYFDAAHCTLHRCAQLPLTVRGVLFKNARTAHGFWFGPMYVLSSRTCSPLRTSLGDSSRRGPGGVILPH